MDTSALVHLWREHYPPDVFPTLWEQLSAHARSGVLRCPREIKKELGKRQDDLFDWCRDREIFVDPDSQVQSCLKLVMSTQPRIIDIYRNSSGGDPWVIAHAMATAGTVVHVEGRRREVTIATVCDTLDVLQCSPLHLIKSLGIRI
ncbi:MAG: DUF4411 family protein [Phycisphaeraceae bacterium]|nr:DUF4411 family protein [Phycisphaeraceae bacterium]